jgi:ribosome recycling factor
MNTYIAQRKSDLEGSMDFFKKEISVIRTGRVNPAVLEGVVVDAYGAKTAINGLASISVSDARSMVVSPWDKSVSKNIEKAIIEADLGLGVSNEGDKLRVTVPQMTEENRKDLVKKLNEKMEKGRISLRQLRDEIKESIEKACESKEINEDDKFRFLKELDEEVRQLNDEIKLIRDKKEEEIMTI